jgi:N-acetylglutamate synthase
MRSEAMTPFEIETATALGWPASSETVIEGWRVFAGLGQVGRVNSCWPLTFDGANVEAAITEVETHYKTFGLVPQFKVTQRACAPSNLDERLKARGYLVKNTTLVMTHSGLLDASVHQVVLTERVTPAIVDVVNQTSPNQFDARERAEILGRVPYPSAFGAIETEGQTVAVGLATLTGASAGIASMRTRAEYRQNGYARSILRAISARARDSGAQTLWLQVENDNVPAIRLYESEGFVVAYAYQTLRLSC